jgi:hypothetical protein
MEVKTNLFVVKGNPLITSPAPLPCFASGVGSVVIDLRDGKEAEVLTIQVLINDLQAHFALPLDDVLDLVDAPGGIERSITIWDTQTGAMRGTCDVGISVELEQPLSVAEVIEQRKHPVLHMAPQTVPIQAPRANDESEHQARPMSTTVPDPPSTSAPDDMFSQLSQKANDLLATARSYAAPLEEKKEEKLVAQEQSVSPSRRRRGGANANFSVNPDLINTVIPE